jgi:predicted transposase/invertase (TIGR01784 family)
MSHRSPHDQFVKSILQHPEKAKAYFQQQLPGPLLARIDLERMRQVSESFVDDKLKGSFSDLLFIAPLIGQEKETYLSLLLEHKSSADPYVTIQIGHYIFSALLRQVRHGEQLTPVIPILLYHGKEPMAYKTHRQLYEGLGKELLEYVPDFTYIYNDLQSTTEEEITAGDIAALRSMFLMLKYAHDESTLLRLAAQILGLVGEDRNYFRTYFVYFTTLIKEKTEIMKSIKDLPTPFQREARNAYEAFLMEGMEKGLKMGREEGRSEGARKNLVQNVKGLYKNGISKESIAKSLDLTESEVNAILQEDEG